jgi:hypothetical protein
MSRLLGRLRPVLGRFVAGTAARKRSLLALACLPLAAAFVAGVAIGVGAESGGWGVIAILASIPIALGVALAIGRLLFGAAQSIRRVQGAFWLVDKLEPLQLSVLESAPRRVNIVHPAIDLKHFFGGFIAVFNLARRLAERGHRVRLVALEGPELPRDWRRRLGSYEGIGSWIEGLEVAFCGDRSRALEVSPDDTLIATHWNAAHVAAAAMRELRHERFLYLVQEYEPFIFPMGSAGALCRQSYELPHTAMFSTELLRGWFAAHRVGVYASGPEAGVAASVSFDNAITPVGPIEVAALRRPGPRRLLFYARPEEHAARNLYEIGAMALDRALERGCFEGWDLAGMGTVAAQGSELILPRSGRSLRLIPRSSQAEYAELLRSADAGLSLMYTPHPSLPPIEMAAAGMPTVTNTYENKDAAALADISANLIAAEPTLDGVVAALGEAERRSGELDRRAAGSHVKWPSRWEDSLDDGVMGGVERLLGIGS